MLLCIEMASAIRLPTPYHTVVHCIKLVCMDVIPDGSPLLMMMHKNALKQLVEDKWTKHMDYWNYILWSDKTKIN